MPELWDLSIHGRHPLSTLLSPLETAGYLVLDNKENWHSGSKEGSLWCIVKKMWRLKQQQTSLAPWIYEVGGEKLLTRGEQPAFAAFSVLART